MNINVQNILVNNMEIWQIKYFIQVYKCKSFSKAAENLHISQQGLSRTIKNIEDELGLLLFERSPKGVQPTAFGSVLLEKANRVVDEYDLMMDFLHKNTELKKDTVFIGLPHSLYTNLFAEVLCDFQEKYPDIKLEIVELASYACERGVEHNFLDISFAIKPVNFDKFEFKHLFNCDMCILANKDNVISQNSTVEFHQLKNENFIMLSSKYKSRELIIERCQKCGFSPHIAYTASQIDLIIGLVALNKGIAILPKPNSVSAVGNHDKLSVVSFADSPFKMEIGFIINKSGKQNDMIYPLIEYTLQYSKDKGLY